MSNAYIVTVSYDGHDETILNVRVSAVNVFAALLRAFEQSSNRTVTLNPDERCPKEA